MELRYSERVTVPASPLADVLTSQGYGTPRAHGKLQVSLPEAIYLHEKGTLTLTDARGKSLTLEQLERKAARLEPGFWIRYAVFKDLRKRGYVVKTALKYGADFRVYDRGVKPGQDHSKWIVYPVHERAVFGWHDFAAKNRIAHATQKRLMLGIVDDEAGIIYYEVRWVRP